MLVSLVPRNDLSPSVATSQTNGTARWPQFQSPAGDPPRWASGAAARAQKSISSLSGKVPARSILTPLAIISREPLQWPRNTTHTLTRLKFSFKVGNQYAPSTDRLLISGLQEHHRHQLRLHGPAAELVPNRYFSNYVSPSMRLSTRLRECYRVDMLISFHSSSSCHAGYCPRSAGTLSKMYTLNTSTPWCPQLLVTICLPATTRHCYMI